MSDPKPPATYDELVTEIKRQLDANPKLATHARRRVEGKRLNRRQRRAAERKARRAARKT